MIEKFLRKMADMVFDQRKNSAKCECQRGVNGSAPDYESGGCGFKSHRCRLFFTQCTFLLVVSTNIIKLSKQSTNLTFDSRTLPEEIMSRNLVVNLSGLSAKKELRLISKTAWRNGSAMVF